MYPININIKSYGLFGFTNKLSIRAKNAYFGKFVVNKFDTKPQLSFVKERRVYFMKFINSGSINSKISYTF
jgi:hypothetical protein